MGMSDLSAKKCVPCEGGVPHLPQPQARLQRSSAFETLAPRFQYLAVQKTRVYPLLWTDPLGLLLL